MAPDDWRRGNPRFQGENFAKNVALVEHVRQLADEKGCTPAQLALAWLLARDPCIIPIPGTRRKERLAENLGASELMLTPDDLADIDRAAAEIAVHGARYPEHLQKLFGR